MSAPAAPSRRPPRTGWAAKAALLAAGVALCAWLGLTHVAPSYDGLYSLAWGQDIAHGHDPDLLHPLAPFAHPLPIMVGAALSLFGPGIAFDLISILAAASFLLLAVAAFRLARVLTSTRPADLAVAAGLFAMLLVISRNRVEFFALRATLDVPFAALVLLALSYVLETPRSRPLIPLTMLAVAGLLRPEAWVLGLAYWAWLYHAGQRGPALWRCGALALAPIALWFLFSWLAAGDPLTPIEGNPESVSISEIGFAAPPGGSVYHVRLLTLVDEGVDGIRSLLGDELAIAGLVAIVWSLYSLRDPARRDERGIRFGLVAGFVLLMVAQTVALAKAGAPLPDRYVLTPAVAMVILVVAWIWLLPAGWAMRVTLLLILAALTGALSGEPPYWPTLPKVRSQFREAAQARNEEEDLYRLTDTASARESLAGCDDNVVVGGAGGPHYVLFAKPLVAHGLEIGPQKVTALAEARLESGALAFLRNTPPIDALYLTEGNWVLQTDCLGRPK